jgi:tetratricopeptide (TPR) repeat protein
MLRYVSGRPPRVVKGRLKLPGGKQTGERALYLTYRQLAFHTIVDRLAGELSGDEPVAAIKRSLREEGEPRHLAERLFRLMDRKRAQVRREAVDQAFALARKGKLDQALQAFDKLLAADPFHSRREEIAGFFFRRGRELHQVGKNKRALRLLTKALHLAPEGSHAASARAYRSAAEAAAPSPEPSHRVTALPASLREIDARNRRGALVAGIIACVLALALLAGLKLLRGRLSSM